MAQDPESEESTQNTYDDDDSYNPHRDYEQQIDEAITAVMDGE